MQSKYLHICAVPDCRLCDLCPVEMHGPEGQAAGRAASDPGLSGATQGPDPPHPARSGDPGHHDGHHNHHRSRLTPVSALDQAHQQQWRGKLALRRHSSPYGPWCATAEESASAPRQQLTTLQVTRDHML